MTMVQNHKNLIMGGVLILALIAFGGLAYYAFQDKEAWQHQLEAFLESARGTPWALPLVCASYVVGGAIFFPVMVLNLACAVVFGLWGILYSLIGAIMSASIMFGVGRLLHDKYAQKVFKRWPVLIKLDNALNKGGVAGIAAIHMVPVPPFTTVNICGGLSSISYPVYITGTFIALLPGAVARGVVGDSLTKILLHPTPETYAYLGLGLCLWVGLIAGTHYLTRKFKPVTAT